MKWIKPDTTPRFPAFILFFVVGASGLASVRADAVTIPSTPATSMRQEDDSKDQLDPRTPPTSTEWIRFMHLDLEESARLWNDHSYKGFTFPKWHWKWRLGWIRVCREASLGDSNPLKSICPTILEQAFQDRALVVRAEAVSALGQIHDGTGDARISQKLLKATSDPKNKRKNAPVMVQRRALYAIKKIGHPDFIKAAAAVANRDPALKAYWQKLNATKDGAAIH